MKGKTSILGRIVFILICLFFCKQAHAVSCIQRGPDGTIYICDNLKEVQKLIGHGEEVDLTSMKTIVNKVDTVRYDGEVNRYIVAIYNYYDYTVCYRTYDYDIFFFSWDVEEEDLKNGQ